MIDRLISLVRGIDLELSAEDIADLLWLAEKISPPYTSNLQQTADTDEQVITEEEKFVAKKAEAPDAISDLKSPSDVPPAATPIDRVDMKPGKIFPLSPTRSASDQGKGSQGATPIRIPTAPTLPGALEIARVLRPLMRKIPGQLATVLDEDATTQRYAETRLPVPVLRRAMERMFGVDLVVDESRSMAVWGDTISSLRTLLERHGAFTDLRVWWLDTNNGPDKVFLYAQPKNTHLTRRAIDPREAFAPRVRRIVLIVSDCVALPWHSGAVARDIIVSWGGQSVVSILQVLPQRLWRRTALGPAPSVRVRASSAGATNSRLEVDTETSVPNIPMVLVPVVTLEPARLVTWAQAITGTPGIWSPGRLLAHNPAVLGARRPDQVGSDNPDELIRRFRASASPTAQRLAELVSIVPLTSLPIMGLIRATLLPQARQTHLAEVLLSGLLSEYQPNNYSQLSESDRSYSSSELMYVFHPGVAERLQQSVGATATVDVLGTVSHYIERHFGQTLNFQALLADPASAEKLIIDESLTAFADISAKALQRLGGGFSKIAQGLARAGTSKQSEEIKVAVPVEPHPAYSAEPTFVEPNILASARSLLETLDANLLPEVAELPLGSRMPFQANAQLLADQKQLLAVIQELIATKNSGASRVVITGPGGSGKTRLVTEIAYRYGHFFAGGVFWISCLYPDNIPIEIAACGAHIDLRPDFSSLPLDEQVRLVLRHWLNEMPRLLIFDGCDRESDIARWLPPAGGSWSLITSQRIQWSESLGARIVSIAAASRQDNLATLVRARPDLASSPTTLEQLVSILGDASGAISAAIAYLTRYPNIDATTYIHRLTDPHIAGNPTLQAIREPNRRVVDQTLLLNAKALEAEGNLGQQLYLLLGQISYLSQGSHVPRTLVEKLSQSYRSSSPNSDELLAPLFALALAEPLNDGGLAPTVSDELVLPADADTAKELASSAIQKLIDYTQEVSDGGQPRAALDIQPILRNATERTLPAKNEIALLLAIRQSEHLLMFGDYGRADRYLQNAATLAEQISGAQSADRAIIFNLQGTLARVRLDLNTARSFYERALAIREEALGGDHPDTATSLNNLGVVLHSQEDLPRAQELLVRSLTIRERVLGSEHPSTATSLHNLAAILQSAGNPLEAQRLYERALAINERALGAQHPITAQTMNNLAGVLYFLGDRREALALYQRALDAYQASLGQRHPEAAAVLLNIAKVQLALSQFDSAETNALEAVSSFKEYLGVEHPRTKVALEELNAIRRVRLDQSGLFGGGYGLVVGVSAYSDPAWDIPVGVRDAEAIYAALTDAAAGGYPAEQVELLLGAEATSAAVLQALGRLAARAGTGDTVFIAITSHGAPAENSLYTLATSDAQFVGGEHIRNGSGLSIVALADALKQIRSERLLLVINACFAASLSQIASQGELRTAPTGTVIPNNESDSLLASGKGRAMITASKADQHSYYQDSSTPDSYSYFGQALVDGLRGIGVSAAGGYIGLFELYGVLHKQLVNWAASAGLVQEPVLSLVEGVGPFPVARYPKSAQSDASLIAQRPPENAEVRTITFQISDNRKVIDFGSAQIGSVTFRGDVAQGDIIKTYHGGQQADDGDGPIDPLKELPKLQQRVAIARNVDEDDRDEAAIRIKQALRALDANDSAKAIHRIDQALAILDAMNTGYINSAARKLRAVRNAL